MGTIVASAIISKASIVLQDTTPTRWPVAELLGWLNDGQREICVAMPELSTTLGNITLVAGTKQTLPNGAMGLLRIVRNMGLSGAAPGLAPRKVAQELLDATAPDWHTQTPATAIKHYVYDVRAPKVFYVSPPSVVNNTLEALYTTPPADIASAVSTITLDDIFEPALLDYVLYRAYGKDIEIAGSSERSAQHRSNFTALIAAKRMVDQADAPKDADKAA